MGGTYENRFDRYPNGAVPQSNRSPQDQLAYLDPHGFIATKERAKLQRKLAQLATVEKAGAETNEKPVRQRNRRPNKKR